jgi:hypothetical protein
MNTTHNIESWLPTITWYRSPRFFQLGFIWIRSLEHEGMLGFRVALFYIEMSLSWFFRKGGGAAVNDSIRWKLF